MRSERIGLLSERR